MGLRAVMDVCYSTSVWDFAQVLFAHKKFLGRLSGWLSCVAVTCPAARRGTHCFEPLIPAHVMPTAHMSESLRMSVFAVCLVKPARMSVTEIDVHVRTSSDRIATRHDVRVRVFAYIVWPMTRPESKVVV